MLILHAPQTLLNTSGIKPVLYLSEPSPGQELHSWYLRLLATGYPGKLLTLYVHNPTMIIVVCRGKTIRSTWPQFCERLPRLLGRFCFPFEFIKKEMSFLDGYVVSKSNSQSMLAYINQVVYHFEYYCREMGSYDLISLDDMEEKLMEFLYGSNYSNQEEYSFPINEWEKKLGVQLKRMKYKRDFGT